MIDVDEFVWRTTIPLTSDSSALTHFKPNQSYHALATQQNVLSQRFYPVKLTSSGGSLGYLYEGQIVGFCQTSSGSSPALTHSNGTVVRGYGDPRTVAPASPDPDYPQYGNAYDTSKTWTFVIPLAGVWSVSGLSGDSLFFV